MQLIGTLNKFGQIQRYNVVYLGGGHPIKNLYKENNGIRPQTSLNVCTPPAYRPQQQLVRHRSGYENLSVCPKLVVYGLQHLAINFCFLLADFDILDN